MQDYDVLCTCDIQWLLEDKLGLQTQQDCALKPSTSTQDIQVMTILSPIADRLSLCLMLSHSVSLSLIVFRVPCGFVVVSGRALGAGWSGGLLFAPSVHCLSLELAARHPGRFWCCVPWAQRKHHSCWMLLDGCCKVFFWIMYIILWYDE